MEPAQELGPRTLLLSECRCLGERRLINDRCAGADVQGQVCNVGVQGQVYSGQCARTGVQGQVCRGRYTVAGVQGQLCRGRCAKTRVQGQVCSVQMFVPQWERVIWPRSNLGEGKWTE